MKLTNIIQTVANKYIGEKEIKGNQGFKNPEFERKMKAVGFQEGHAWCAYFAELVWKEAYQQYDSTFIPILDKLFSASAVQTFRNFENFDGFETDRECPEVGDVVIWQNYKNGKPHWTGHAGIVVSTESIDDPNCYYRIHYDFESVEGNTNSQGGREGIEVAIKKRNTYTHSGNGLNILGFIKPYTY